LVLTENAIMPEFSYVRAFTISEAVALLNEPGVNSRPLAGSTDLILQLRANPSLCDRVVDISLIPELHQIIRRDHKISIGAAATFSEVLTSPIIAQTAPLLVQACAQVGAVQIRNMGTLGGNVANAAACADSLPALVCIDADARILTPQSEQVIPISQLVDKPNHTLIPSGGLLIALEYQVPPVDSRSVFLKLGRRNAMAISRLTVAALGRLDSTGKIAEARLVTGSTTPQICRLKPIEDFLIGKSPSQELFSSVARLTADEMIRLSGRRWSTEFKEPALISLVQRALAQIFTPEAV
jgi:CO/xanthine dehydrogenase FAD-binding subunit